MANLELQNVIQKIRGLSSKTVSRGCSEGEALNAANKIGELLKVYNLSIDQVFLDSEKCIQKTIKTNKKNRPLNCLYAISDFCDCKYWYSYSYDEKYQNKHLNWNLFGMPTDVEMAEYLYNIIESAIEQETENFKKSAVYLEDGYYSKKLKTKSFQRGMFESIGEKLENMKEEINKSNQNDISLPGDLINSSCDTVNLPNSSNCSSIVLIKNKKVDSEFDKLGLNLVYPLSRSMANDDDSINEGKIAGKRVNLNRPLSEKSTLLLT